ncbi:hypothetical protein FOA52_005921 [Chlamydomonas sp. UWO 241]|nr:hypothetical protein FOA52_005921 [Chlamydomonas sp. UWO 241]
MRWQSDKSYPYGILNRRKISLDIPKNVSLVANVVTAEAGKLELKPGDVSVSKRLSNGVDVLHSSFYYPFDQYKATIAIDSTLGDGDSAFWQMPLLIQQTTRAVGWKSEMVESEDPTDSFIHPVSGTSDGSSYLTYQLTIERTWFVKFFAVITLIFMWLLGGFAFIYGIDAL